MPSLPLLLGRPTDAGHIASTSKRQRTHPIVPLQMRELQRERRSPLCTASKHRSHPPTMRALAAHARLGQQSRADSSSTSTAREAQHFNPSAGRSTAMPYFFFLCPPPRWLLGGALSFPRIPPPPRQHHIVALRAGRKPAGVIHAKSRARRARRRTTVRRRQLTLRVGEIQVLLHEGPEIAHRVPVEEHEAEGQQRTAMSRFS